MTNEQLKQQAIQEAYGEYYEALKEFINCEGVFVGDTDLISDELFDAWQFIGVTPRIKSERKTSGSRPKSLAGIDDNNGWMRIEQDGSNLPVEGVYVVGKMTKSGIFFEVNSKVDFQSVEYYFDTGCTHYRPVVEYPKPVY